MIYLRLVSVMLSFGLVEAAALAASDQTDTSLPGTAGSAQLSTSQQGVSENSTAGASQPVESAAYKGGLIFNINDRSRLSTELFAGLRYDTNANEAANTLVPGQQIPVVIPSVLQSHADGSVVTKVAVSHRYDFFGWPNTVWETNADVSDQRFFRISPNYDLTVVQANTGPRYYLWQLGQGNISVRPFGSFVWTAYNDQTYSSLYGGGVSADYRTSRWSATLAAIGWFGNYLDTAFRPLTRPYTGPERVISLSTTFAITPTTSSVLALWWYQADGRSADFSRRGPAASLSVKKALPLMHRTAELAVFGSVQRILYGGPPPQTQTLSAREDTLLTGNLSLSVPISPSASMRIQRDVKVVFQYQYLREHSNYSPFIDNALTVGFRLPL